MARARQAGRGDGGSSWIATALGMAVLLAVGFFLGVVAGVLWEAPELVVRHLAGQDEELAWGPDAEAAFTDPAAFAPARAGREAQSEVDAEPDAASAPTWEEGGDPLPSVSAEEGALSPKPEVVFAVQVGAFSESSAAEKMARTLGADGYSVYVVPATGLRDSRWRVRVGPVASRSEAQELADQLKLKKGVPTWVVSEGVD